MRPLSAATLTLVLVAPLAVVGGAQFAPGWSPGTPPPPVDPDPLVVTRRCTEAPSTPEPLPGIDVTAWLVTPPSDAGSRDVAVLLIPGAGSATRETLLPQARALAACGIAAVTYDKAGGAILRDFDAWAATVAEVVAATRRATGARHVGVVAWSEGGWVAARLLHDVDLAVTIGAPVVTPAEQVAWHVDAALADAPPALRRIPAAVLAQPTGLGWTQDDIRPLLATSPVPVLGVWGSADHVVPVTSAVHRLRTALPDAAVMVLPGGDHGLSGIDWAPAVAAWLRQPRPGTVQGVEPDQSHGLPVLPRPTWVTHPLIHLAIALGAAAAVGALAHHRIQLRPRHSRNRTPRRTS